MQCCPCPLSLKSCWLFTRHNSFYSPLLISVSLSSPVLQVGLASTCSKLPRTRSLHFECANTVSVSPSSTWRPSKTIDRSHFHSPKVIPLFSFPLLNNHHSLIIAILQPSTCSRWYVYLSSRLFLFAHHTVPTQPIFTTTPSEFNLFFSVLVVERVVAGPRRQEICPIRTKNCPQRRRLLVLRVMYLILRVQMRDVTGPQGHIHRYFSFLIVLLPSLRRRRRAHPPPRRRPYSFSPFFHQPQCCVSYDHPR